MLTIAPVLRLIEEGYSKLFYLIGLLAVAVFGTIIAARQALVLRQVGLFGGRFGSGACRF